MEEPRNLEITPPESARLVAGFAFGTLCAFVLVPTVIFNLIWFLPSLPNQALLLLIVVDLILLPVAYLTIRKGWERFKYSGAAIELDNQSGTIVIRSPWWKPSGTFRHDYSEVEFDPVDRNSRSQQVTFRAARFWIVVKPSWSNFAAVDEWTLRFLE